MKRDAMCWISIFVLQTSVSTLIFSLIPVTLASGSHPSLTFPRPPSPHSGDLSFVTLFPFTSTNFRFRCGSEKSLRYLEIQRVPPSKDAPPVTVTTPTPPSDVVLNLTQLDLGLRPVQLGKRRASCLWWKSQSTSSPAFTYLLERECGVLPSYRPKGVREMSLFFRTRLKTSPARKSIPSYNVDASFPYKLRPRSSRKPDFDYGALQYHYLHVRCRYDKTGASEVVVDFRPSIESLLSTTKKYSSHSKSLVKRSVVERVDPAAGNRPVGADEKHDVINGLKDNLTFRLVCGRYFFPRRAHIFKRTWCSKATYPWLAIVAGLIIAQFIEFHLISL